jgi:thymidylate synthase
LGTLLENSFQKTDRTGTGTLSVFGRQIRHSMKDGFPLLTTKKMAVKTMMTELKWFLKGDTNIKYLVDNNCHIWNGDAYKKYKEAIAEVGLFDNMMSQEEFITKIKNDDKFAKRWGDLGPIYGAQWRDWWPTRTDQIKDLIEQLNVNPDSRRLMVSAWNVSELETMTLPPCHYGFQVYTRVLSQNERWTWYQKQIGSAMHHDRIEQEMDAECVPTRAISLMWNQRSVDTFLGLPFNIASYATLLCLLGQEVNMIPEDLIGNLGDVHLYLNHIDQAEEQISREIYELPTVKFSNVNLLEGEFDYEIQDYKYHPTIKAPLSN